MVDVTLKYKHEVHMNFIHEGTKVLMVKDGQRILITAAMDGHIVSPNYGKLYDPKRTHFADDSEKNYLNVKVDAFPEAYGMPNKKGNFNVNSSLHEKDGWTFKVDDNAFERYKKDLDLFRRQGQEALDARRAAIEADLLHAEQDLARARAELDRLR